MVRIQAKLLVAAEREEVLSDETGWDRIAQVVDVGKPLCGTIQLTAPAGKRASFSGMAIEVIMQKHSLVGKHDTWYFIQGKYPEKHYPMDKKKRYAFVGSMEVPFTIPAEAIRPMETYASPTMKVYCDVRLTMSTGVFTLAQDVAWLAVELLSPSVPTPVPPAERHWMTVADLGGECKLMLDQTETDLSGPITGHVTVQGTAPLEEIQLVLLTTEDEDPPLVTRTATIWSRPEGAELEKQTLDFDFAFALDASSTQSRPVWPSVTKVTEGTFSHAISHSLRLMLKPVNGTQAWNTLPVRLVRTSARGSARGTLTVKPPEMLKGKALLKATLQQLNSEPWYFKLVLLIIITFLFSAIGGAFSLFFFPGTTDFVVRALLAHFDADVEFWMGTAYAMLRGEKPPGAKPIIADLGGFEQALKPEL